MLSNYLLYKGCFNIYTYKENSISTNRQFSKGHNNYLYIFDNVCSSNYIIHNYLMNIFDIFYNSPSKNILGHKYCIKICLYHN